MNRSIQTIRHANFEIKFILVVICQNEITLSQAMQKEFKIYLKKHFERQRCQLESAQYDGRCFVIGFYGIPNMNLSTTVNNIKTVTARRLRKQFPELRTWAALWSDQYGVFTSRAKAKAFLEGISK